MILNYELQKIREEADVGYYNVRALLENQRDWTEENYK
jgi:hypothetical protein